MNPESRARALWFSDMRTTKAIEGEGRYERAGGRASGAAVNALTVVSHFNKKVRKIDLTSLPVVVSLALALVSCGAVSANNATPRAQGISLSPHAQVSRLVMHFMSPNSPGKAILIYASNGLRPTSVVFAANKCAKTAGFFPAYEPSSNAASPPFATVTVDPISSGTCTAMLENQGQKWGGMVTVVVTVGEGVARSSRVGR